MPIPSNLLSVVNQSFPFGDGSSKNSDPSLGVGQPKNFSPSYGAPTYATNQIIAIDDSNNLMTRGQVHTDEGSFRDNFSGTTIGISVGTGVVTNGSYTITGSGFSGLDIHKQDYIKVTADADTFYTQVLFLTDDTITLYSPYTGTGSTTAQALTCAISLPTTGTGGSITVASAQASILSGTTTASQTGISRNVDYGPLVYEIKMSRSQMIANNDFYIGLTDTASTAPASARWYARILFTSIVNTVITSQTGFNRTTAPSGSEIETTSITLPNSLTTATSNVYRIEQWIDFVKFYVNGQIVAIHRQSIPRPCDGLQAIAMSLNTGVPASTTTVVVDYTYVKDLNRVDVGAASIDEYSGTLVKTTLPTVFAPGSIVPGTATSSGVSVTRQNSIPELEWNYPAAAGGISNTTTAVTIKAAAGIGVRNYITAIQITADALGAATEIAIRDGAAGAVIWRQKIGTAGFPNGFSANISNVKSTANTLLEVVTLTASITGAVYFNAQGYQAY